MTASDFGGTAGRPASSPDEFVASDWVSESGRNEQLEIAGIDNGLLLSV